MPALRIEPQTMACQADVLTTTLLFAILEAISREGHGCGRNKTEEKTEVASWINYTIIR